MARKFFVGGSWKCKGIEEEVEKICHHSTRSRRPFRKSCSYLIGEMSYWPTGQPWLWKWKGCKPVTGSGRKVSYTKHQTLVLSVYTEQIALLDTRMIESWLQGVHTMMVIVLTI